MKKPSSETQSTMNEYSSHAFIITKVLFVLYLLCLFAFYAYPVIIYTFFSMKEPMLPINIPFVDMNTKEGFMITSVYHVVIVYIASIGLGFCDALFLNLVFNVLTMAELQVIQQQKLNEELDIPKFPASAVQIRLRNFFIMNQEMEKYVFFLLEILKWICFIQLINFRYIEIIDDTYYWMIFVQILTTSLSIVLIVFIIMTVIIYSFSKTFQITQMHSFLSLLEHCNQMTWIPAYMLAFCLVFQLFLFCALGTIVEIAVSKFLYIDNQFNLQISSFHQEWQIELCNASNQLLFVTRTFAKRFQVYDKHCTKGSMLVLRRYCKVGRNIICRGTFCSLLQLINWCIIFHFFRKFQIMRKIYTFIVLLRTMI